MKINMDKMKQRLENLKNPKKDLRLSHPPVNEPNIIINQIILPPRAKII